MEEDGVVRDIISNWGFEGSQAVSSSPSSSGTFEVG